VLVIDAAWRGRAWHERIPCGARRHEGHPGASTLT